RWLALPATVVLMLHPAVLQSLDTIGSDLPGAALWVTAVLLGVRLLERPALDLRRTAVIAVLLGLAVLVRWSALYLAIAFAVGVLSAAPHWSVRERLRAALVLGLVPLCMIGPWVMRNYLSTRTVFGYRRIRLVDPPSVAADALRGLGGGLVDLVGWAPLGAAVLLLALLGLALAHPRTWRPPLRLLSVSAVVFVVLLVGSASVSPIDPLSAPRFWLPIWPLLLAVLIASLVPARGAAHRVGLRMPVLALALVLAGGGFAGAFLDGLDGAAAGRGFLAPSLAGSAPIDYVRGRASATLLCNDPRVVLIHAGVPLIHELPDTAAPVRALLDRPLAVLLFTETMTPRIEARLDAQRRLLAALEDEGRVTRIAADAVGEVWVSR
ncbi:MAG: hypothetical protein ACREJT_10625, partial [Myxococcota bacterium]